MRILSLSTVYPNAAEPGRGLFVRRRLEQLGALAEVTVLAPVLAFDYAKRSWNRSIPRERQDGNVVVLHPRWLYLPGTGCLTSFALAVQLARRFGVCAAHADLT